MRAFQQPLDSAGFDNSKVFAKWKLFKLEQKKQCKGFKFTEVWSYLLKNCQKKFPNILLLAELNLSLLSSNKAVERKFSKLTTLLFNYWLRLNHKIMEECLSIAGNKNAWAESNNEEILDSAVLKYVQKLL